MTYEEVLDPTNSTQSTSGSATQFHSSQFTVNTMTVTQLMNESMDLTRGINNAKIQEFLMEQKRRNALNGNEPKTDRCDGEVTKNCCGEERATLLINESMDLTRSIDSAKIQDCLMRQKQDNVQDLNKLKTDMCNKEKTNNYCREGIAAENCGSVKKTKIQSFKTQAMNSDREISQIKSQEIDAAAKQHNTVYFNEEGGEDMELDESIVNCPVVSNPILEKKIFNDPNIDKENIRYVPIDSFEENPNDTNLEPETMEFTNVLSIALPQISENLLIVQDKVCGDPKIVTNASSAINTENVNLNSTNLNHTMSREYANQSFNPTINKLNLKNFNITNMNTETMDFTANINSKFNLAHLKKDTIDLTKICSNMKANRYNLYTNEKAEYEHSNLTDENRKELNVTDIKTVTMEFTNALHNTYIKSSSFASVDHNQVCAMNSYEGPKNLQMQNLGEKNIESSEMQNVESLKNLKDENIKNSETKNTKNLKEENIQNLEALSSQKSGINETAVNEISKIRNKEANSTIAWDNTNPNIFNVRENILSTTPKSMGDLVLDDREISIKACNATFPNNSSFYNDDTNHLINYSLGCKSDCNCANYEEKSLSIRNRDPTFLNSKFFPIEKTCNGSCFNFLNESQKCHSGFCGNRSEDISDFQTKDTSERHVKDVSEHNVSERLVKDISKENTSEEKLKVISTQKEEVKYLVPILEKTLNDINISQENISLQNDIGPSPNNSDTSKMDFREEILSDMIKMGFYKNAMKLNEQKEFQKKCSNLSNDLRALQDRFSKMEDSLKTFKWSELTIPKLPECLSESESSISSCVDTDSIREEVPPKLTIKEKIIELEKNSRKLWKIEDLDEFIFSVFNGKILLKAFGSEIYVNDIKVENKLSKDCSTKVKFLSKIFIDRMNKEQIKSFIGMRYDLLSLVEYLVLTMDTVVDVCDELQKYRENHLLELNEHLV